MKCVESPNHHRGSSQATHPNVTYFDGSLYSSDSIPEEVDWRTKGAVTEIKDQVTMKFPMCLVLTQWVQHDMYTCIHGVSGGV